MAVVLFLAILALADPQTQAPAPAPPASTASTSEPSVSGVTVNGARAQVETSIDRRSYAVAGDVNAETGSIADVLRSVPSVQVDAQGNPSLLGQGNVTVLIDGRPSAQFSGSNPGLALQTMPANQIDRIEVMTNPPAEFRAEGSGGVINLITKKAKGVGRTGSLRVNAQTHHRADVAVTLGYNSDKLSATGDVTYHRNARSTLDVQDQTQADPAIGPLFNSRDLTFQRWTGSYWQAHLGADYDLDSHNRLSSVLSYSKNGFDTHYNDRFSKQDQTGAPTSVVGRTAREYLFYDTSEASLTWRRTFGADHSLTVNADYKEAENPYNRVDDITPALPVGLSPSSDQLIFTERDRRTTLTADYVQPLAGGTFKLGYDFEYAPNRLDQVTGAGPITGPITLDPAQRYRFTGVETDREAYASYERQAGKFDVLAGLRFEDTRYVLDEQSHGVHANPAYGRLYPNLHLTYDLDGSRQLTASFSRRTNRPSFRQLDPFVTSEAVGQADAGNLALRPEDQYRYDLGYEDRRGDRVASVTLYYHQRRDAFNTIYETQADGVILSKPVNAGQANSAGADWSISDKLSPKLSYSFGAQTYWVELVTPKSGGFQSVSTITGSGHGNLNWQLTPKDLLQLNLFINAKTLHPQGYTLPSISESVGYRHTINAKMSWMVLAMDPFDTLNFRTVAAINGVQNRHLSLANNRSLSLAFVWNFAGKAKPADLDFTGGDGGR